MFREFLVSKLYIICVEVEVGVLMQPLNDMQRSMKWFKKIEQSKLQNEAINKGEYHALLMIYPYGSMERIIFRFAWETGARPLEISRLALSNFSEDFQTVQFCTVKGQIKSKVRECYLSKGFARELEAYLVHLISPYGFLFPNRYLQQPVIAKNYMNQEMTRKRSLLYRLTRNPRWIQKNDIGYYLLHPYSFRYAKIRGLLEQGYSIEEVAQYFEHSKINTTMKYARFMKISKFRHAANLEPEVSRLHIDMHQKALLDFINYTIENN